MDKRTLAGILNVSGYVSILASIAVWAIQGGQGNTPEEKAHGERFGIFVGLWAPTFFILSTRYQEAADKEG